MYNLGMTKQQLVKLAETRSQLFFYNLPSIRSKLEFLQEEVILTGNHEAYLY